MKLSAQWRHILRHAWSVRLLILSSILGGLQIALTVVGVEWIHWHPAYIVALLVALNVGAVVARIVDQRDLDA